MSQSRPRSSSASASASSSSPPSSSSSGSSARVLLSDVEFFHQLLSKLVHLLLEARLTRPDDRRPEQTNKFFKLETDVYAGVEQKLAGLVRDPRRDFSLVVSVLLDLTRIPRDKYFVRLLSSSNAYTVMNRRTMPQYIVLEEWCLKKDKFAPDDDTIYVATERQYDEASRRFRQFFTFLRTLPCFYLSKNLRKSTGVDGTMNLVYHIESAGLLPHVRKPPFSSIDTPVNEWTYDVVEPVQFTPFRTSFGNIAVICKYKKEALYRKGEYPKDANPDTFPLSLSPGLPVGPQSTPDKAALRNAIPKSTPNSSGGKQISPTNAAAAYASPVGASPSGSRDRLNVGSSSPSTSTSTSSIPPMPTKAVATAKFVTPKPSAVPPMPVVSPSSSSSSNRAPRNEAARNAPASSQEDAFVSPGSGENWGFGSYLDSRLSRSSKRSGSGKSPSSSWSSSSSPRESIGSSGSEDGNVQPAFQPLPSDDEEEEYEAEEEESKKKRTTGAAAAAAVPAERTTSRVQVVHGFSPQGPTAQPPFPSSQPPSATASKIPLASPPAEIAIERHGGVLPMNSFSDHSSSASSSFQPGSLGSKLFSGDDLASGNSAEIAEFLKAMNSPPSLSFYRTKIRLPAPTPHSSTMLQDDGLSRFRREKSNIESFSEEVSRSVLLERANASARPHHPNDQLLDANQIVLSSPSPAVQIPARNRDNKNGNNNNNEGGDRGRYFRRERVSPSDEELGSSTEALAGEAEDDGDLFQLGSSIASQNEYSLGPHLP